MALSPPDLVVHLKAPKAPKSVADYSLAEEKPACCAVCCDTCWACILNDYIEKDEWFDDLTFATWKTETTVHPVSEEIREVQQPVVLGNDEIQVKGHGIKKKKKKGHSRKKKTTKKKKHKKDRIDENPPMQSPTAALDVSIPEHVETNDGHSRQTQLKKDQSEENPPRKPLPSDIEASILETHESQSRSTNMQNDQVNKVETVSQSKPTEERETMGVFKLDEKNISEQLPFRAPQRAILTNPEIETNQNDKGSEKHEKERDYESVVHQTWSTSQGQSLNHDQAELQLALAQSRLRSRRLQQTLALPKDGEEPPDASSDDDLQAALGISQSRSRSRGKGRQILNPALSKGDNDDLQAALGISQSRSRSRGKGRQILDLALAKSDSMLLDRYQKVDMYHYAPIISEGAKSGPIPRSYDAMEPQPKDPAIPKSTLQEELSIPREVKVKKKPKITKKPLKGTEGNLPEKDKLSVDPREERSDKSSHSRASQRSFKSNRSAGAGSPRSRSRSGSRDRPKPEDAYIETIIRNGLGDGSIDRPFNISNGRYSSNLRNRAKQEADASTNGTRRHRSQDAEGRYERLNTSRTYDVDHLRWLVDEGKKAKKESTRRFQKVDRKEALARIRAIKARLSSVDP